MKYTKILYDLRTDHDLTQEEVAQILKTSKQNYSRYENGRRKLNIEDLITLSKFYKVSTDYILGLKDKNYLTRTVIDVIEKPTLTNNETKIKRAIEKKLGKIDYEIIEEISDCLKISKNDVVQIMENGDYPSIQTYIELADYLGTTLDELLR